MTKIKEFTSAISTPLASIFGSGFLVMLPILVSTVGSYAVQAMILIVVFAYTVGSVIRYNIKNAEPILQGHPKKTTYAFERASDIALVLAYIVSISLYLNIMSAFVLNGFNIGTTLNENMLTTGVIVLISLIGMTKGLQPLEILEKYSLGVTLFVVALLLVFFGLYDFDTYSATQSFIMPQEANKTSWEIIATLAGMLIVVQGFETSRYLGEEYTSDLRIQTSKYSQIISSFVYVIFIALSLPTVHLLTDGCSSDDSLIALIAQVAPFMVLPLIGIAALSQFSAAVADTLAATGNLDEIGAQYFTKTRSYLFVGISAVVITWSIDTMQILALASRAFALYYLFQTLVAISISTNKLHTLGMVLVACVLGFITVFAIPVG